MCLYCAVGSDKEAALAQRAHVLALLALVEHPEGIPGDAALRLGREILALVGAEPGIPRCEAVSPAGPAEPVRKSIPVRLRRDIQHE